MTTEQWQRAKSLFNAALQTDAAHRAEFLEQAFRSEDVEVARQVEELLAVHAAADSFLETPAGFIRYDKPPQNSIVREGSLIGRYRVHALLGSGGMGEVYLAEDPRLQRKVALKLLPRDLATDIDRLRRFEQEARTASALSHPNVCVIYEIGETDVPAAEGRRFIAMEYIAGESLRDVIRRHAKLGTRMPVDEVVSIARQIAMGLQAAHAAGVVHRDVKPENVMVRPDGLVKVLDFGLAKLTEGFSPVSGMSSTESSHLDSAHTEPGVVLGTVQYMSPEQARGLALDARTDVWSLGAVVYEMLVGQPAFVGDTTSDILVAVLEREPPLLAEGVKDVPRALQDLVASALTKDREKRLQTMAELTLRLTRIDRDLERDSDSLSEHDASVSTESSKTSRDRPFTAWPSVRWAAIGVVALMLSWLAMSALRRERSGSVNRGDPVLEQKYVVAVLPFENLSADTSKAYVAAGLTEEITGQLSQISALRVLSRSVVGPYRNVANKLPKMVSQLGVGSVVEGSVRAQGDRARIAVQLTDARSGAAIWSQQYDRQLTDIFAVQSQVARSITDALQASLTPDEARRAGRPPTVNLEAYQLYMGADGATAKSPSQMLAATKSLQRAIKLDTTFSLAYTRLARLYLFLAATANPAYRDSGLVAVRKAIAVDPANASAYVTLGGLLGESGKLQAGKTSLLKAFDLNPNSDAAADDLAVTFGLLGVYDEALVWAVRAVTLAPTSHVAHYHVAAVLLRLGDDTATERFLARVEQRFDSSSSNRRPSVSMRMGVLGSLVEVLRGRNELAMQRARRVLLDNPGNQEATLNVGLVAALTNPADAEALLAPLTASSPDTRAEVFPESMQTLYAAVLARRGRRSEADALWASALTRDAREVGQGNEGAEPRAEIAAINAMKGKKTEAMKWLELAFAAGFKDPRVLARDPLFEPLRADPGYRKLLAKMKAGADAMRRRAVATNDTLFARSAR